MKNNNKGFVLMETIIVISVLSVTLLLLYSSYSTIITKSVSSSTYDTTDNIYKMYYSLLYLSDNKSINDGINVLLNDSSNCIKLKDNSKVCEYNDLKNAYDVEKIYILYNDFFDDNNYTLLDATAIDYVRKKVNTLKENEYNIIFKFKKLIDDNGTSDTSDDTYEYYYSTFETSNFELDESEGTSGRNLYNLIKSNAKTDTIDFSVNSATSNTNGIYITTETDSGDPVYYYRGSYTALNNNVIFNNMCWKIIRTTETGGVKIIYNGTPTDGKCETQTGLSTQLKICTYNYLYTDNAFVGYMYGTLSSTTYDNTHNNSTISSIKGRIDDWYKNYFKDDNILNKIEDTVFCNDRSTVSGGVNNSLDSSIGTLGYGSLSRVSNFTLEPKPSLKCSNDNDKFTVSSEIGNGALTYPVGTITLDEVVLAGYNTHESNTSDYKNLTNYLYTNQDYWTMSPIYANNSGNVSVGYITNAGYIWYNAVTSSFGVRPVISLIKGTLVDNDSDGSTTNPYIVQ